MTERSGRFKAVAFLLIFFLTTLPASSYSVQTHQELIDLAWNGQIRPILLERFPGLTEAQIEEAHAYAYGGCAIQDIGYYPFGKAFFSDLTHYVRSGDFVLSLMHNAKTADELAFAVGALSHYVGDIFGHAYAVNHSVPVEFPGLAKKYGPVVNYAQSPHAHVRTEFAFDINQLSKGRFAPAGYLQHVGLYVSPLLLRTAFNETYGLKLRDIVGDGATALSVYRRSVRHFLPNIAEAEAILHRKSFPNDTPGDDFDQLRTELLRIAQDSNWKQYAKPPGFGSHLYAGFIFILPKFGPLSLLAIKGPTAYTEDLYIHSLSRSLRAMRLILANFDSIDTYIANRDLDTGQVVKPGAYPLADKTYERLLAKLTEYPTLRIPAQLKHDVENYYADPQAPIVTKKDGEKWRAVEANLKTLAAMSTIGKLDLASHQVLDPK
jgi:hypothetical protein